MLKSYNDGWTALLVRLFGQMARPDARGLRTGIVQHNTETTYVVPGDWPPLDGARWLPDRQLPSSGSEVEHLLDGPATFEAMAEAMRTAQTKSHFIVLLGWSLSVHTRMTGAGAAAPATFLEIIEERGWLGVPVRVLLWDNTLMTTDRDEDDVLLPAGAASRRVNENAKLALEKLRTDKGLDVHCSLDDNTKGWVSGLAAWVGGASGSHSYGSHHHKILIVYGSEGLIGFCGGVDIDPNRLTYLHDAHVRVRGFAAEELWKIVKMRWAESEDNGNPPVPPSISALAPASFSGPERAPYLAIVAQTVGNPKISKSVPNTLWPAVREAIARASSFVYMEDQYFWSLDLVDALIEASARLRHITILVPAALTGEQAYMRQAAIAALVKRGGKGIEKRIGIFQSNAKISPPSGGPDVDHSYVHAKLFVVDDEYAIVTTANANNRGYFFDSEAAVGVAERAARDPSGVRRGDWAAIEGNWARRLRIQLWAEHLKLAPEELLDGVGAHAHWLSLPQDAQVAVYNALNLKKLQKIQYVEQVEHTAGVTGVAGSKPAWDRAADVKVWWDAPFDEWAPESPPEDRIVDPKWPLLTL